ncbi:MAG: sugar ABC transporter substrate-binding protein [Desulfobacteraceae bacterium]
MFRLKDSLQNRKRSVAVGTKLFSLFILLLILAYAPAWSDDQSVSAQHQAPASNVAATQSEKAAAKSSISAKELPESATIPSFDKSKINWRRFDGSTLNVLLSGHPIQGTIIGLLSDFKKLTGITVNVDVLPEEDFFQKLRIDFESRKGGIDVFMTAPLYQWQYAKAGWIEDLSPYIADAALTDKAWYNPDDFFPLVWNAAMWNGTIGSGLGQGALYCIPAWWEGCNLMYRKDLAEKYGFQEPKTWNDLYDQVSRIPRLSNGELYGFIGRGIRSWSQIHTYHMTMMASYGVRDLDPLTGRAVFNSSRGVEIGKYWVKMMQVAGSPKWPEYNWYEVAAEFQAGKYFAIMDANPFATILEAQGSPVRGKVGYLLPPPGPKGRQSFLWVWGLGINSFSNHKKAGWLFIQWITSQHMLRQAIKYGNWMTPRRSVWFDPEVAAFLRTIDDGRWYENSTKLVTQLAAMRWSPNPLAPKVGNLWAGAIQDAWRGKYTVEQALDKAAAEVDALMKQAGYGQ